MANKIWDSHDLSTPVGLDVDISDQLELSKGHSKVGAKNFEYLGLTVCSITVVVSPYLSDFFFYFLRPVLSAIIVFYSSKQAYCFDLVFFDLDDLENLRFDFDFPLLYLLHHGQNQSEVISNRSFSLLLAVSNTLMHLHFQRTYTTSAYNKHPFFRLIFLNG